MVYSHINGYKLYTAFQLFHFLFFLLRYYAVCRPDQMLSFTLDRHNLEPPVVCTDTARCVDSLTMYRPIYGNGSVSITCGAVEGFIGFELSSLLVEFKTNRKIEDCGFRIFVTCTDQELSFSQGCTTPNEPTEQKRKRREGLQVRFQWIQEIFCFSLFGINNPCS